MALTEEKEWTLESLLHATHQYDTVFGRISYPKIIGNFPTLVEGKWRYENDVIDISTSRDPRSGKFTRITIIADRAGPCEVLPSTTISLQKGEYSSTRPIPDQDIINLGKELENSGIKLSGKAYHYCRQNQEQINKTDLWVVGP